MRITSKYITRQILRPVSISMLVFLLLVLSERTVRLLDVSLGKQDSFSMLFSMLANLMPHYLGFAIPASLTLGLLFGFNKLSKNSEIDAFLSAGIGYHNMVKPAMILALIATIIGTIIFAWLQPHSRYTYRVIKKELKSNNVGVFVKEGVFITDANKTFFLDKISKKDGRFKRVFVYEEKPGKGSKKISRQTTTTAKYGKIISSETTNRPILLLEDGYQLKIKTNLGVKGAKLNLEGVAPDKILSPTVTKEQEIIRFKKFATPIGSEEDEEEIRERGKDERELTLPELYQNLYGGNSKKNKYKPQELRAEMHYRLIAIGTLLILPIFALPFSIGMRRGQRGYRFVLAIIILFAFYTIVQQSSIAAKKHNISVYWSMWLPYIIMVTFSTWRFYRLTFTLKAGRMNWLAETVNLTFSKLYGKLFKWNKI